MLLVVILIKKIIKKMQDYNKIYKVAVISQQILILLVPLSVLFRWVGAKKTLGYWSLTL